MVPAMVGLFGFSQHRAQGTSLLALLSPTGAFAIAEYWRAGNTDVKAGALIALGFLGGALLGSRISLQLDEVMMRRAFGCLLLVVGTWMLLRK